MGITLQEKLKAIKEKIKGSPMMGSPFSISA